MVKPKLSMIRKMPNPKMNNELSQNMISEPIMTVLEMFITFNLIKSSHQPLKIVRSNSGTSKAFKSSMRKMVPH